MRTHPLLVAAIAVLATLAGGSPAEAEVVRSDDQGAAAKPKVVAMGEVKIFSSAADEVRLDELRQEAMSALATVDLSGVPAGSRAVVSVTLVRNSPTAQNPEPSCVVTALVRDVRREALVATIETRARSPLGSTGTVSAQEKRAMMRSAVRGAMAQLPGALTR